MISALRWSPAPFMQLGSDRVRLRTLEEKGRNLRLEEQLASVIPAVISHRDHIPRLIRLETNPIPTVEGFGTSLTKFVSPWALDALRGSRSRIGNW